MSDASQVRNCYKLKRNDLNSSNPDVQFKLAEYLNEMINIGVKGFRVDSAEYMETTDLESIQMKLKGYPFMIHEVRGNNSENIDTWDYLPLGMVTEFATGRWISDCFNGSSVDDGKLQCLYDFGYVSKTFAPLSS